MESMSRGSGWAITFLRNNPLARYIEGFNKVRSGLLRDSLRFRAMWRGTPGGGAIQRLARFQAACSVRTSAPIILSCPGTLPSGARRNVSRARIRAHALRTCIYIYMQRDAGSYGRRIVSGKERMTADADAVIIPGAERSRMLGSSLLGLCPGARMHLITSKNTKLQLTSLTSRAILSYCSSPRERSGYVLFSRSRRRACSSHRLSWRTHVDWPLPAWIGHKDGSRNRQEIKRPSMRRKLRGRIRVRDRNLWRELLRIHSNDSFPYSGEREREGGCGVLEK